MAEFEELRLHTVLVDDASTGLARLNKEIKQVGSGPNAANMEKFRRQSIEVRDKLRPMAEDAALAGAGMGKLALGVGIATAAIGAIGVAAAAQYKALQLFSAEMVKLGALANQTGQSAAQIRSMSEAMQRFGASPEGAAKTVQGLSAAMADLERTNSRVRNELMRGNMTGEQRRDLEEFLATLRETKDIEEFGNRVKEAMDNVYREGIQKGMSPARAAEARRNFARMFNAEALIDMQEQFQRVGPEERKRENERIQAGREYFRLTESITQNVSRFMQLLTSQTLTDSPLLQMLERADEWTRKIGDNIGRWSEEFQKFNAEPFGKDALGKEMPDWVRNIFGAMTKGEGGGGLDAWLFDQIKRRWGGGTGEQPPNQQQQPTPKRDPNAKPLRFSGGGNFWDDFPVSQNVEDRRPLAERGGILDDRTKYLAENTAELKRLNDWLQGVNAKLGGTPAGGAPGAGGGAAGGLGFLSGGAGGGDGLGGAAGAGIPGGGGGLGAAVGGAGGGGAGGGGGGAGAAGGAVGGGGGGLGAALGADQIPGGDGGRRMAALPGAGGGLPSSAGTVAGAPEAGGAPAGGAQAGGGGGPAPMGGPGAGFAQKAPGIMANLQKDFSLTREQAAGIVGNLGHETGGFKLMQEQKPTVAGSRGGFGWAQWTGPRRRQFEAWSKQQGLDPKSDEANYGFLKHELQTTHKGSIAAVKRTGSAQEAMRSFEGTFERAGVKHYASRSKYTQQAMNLPAAETPAGAGAPAGLGGGAPAGIPGGGGAAVGGGAAPGRAVGGRGQDNPNAAPPPAVLAQARQVAAAGGMPAVQRFMAQQGYPRNGAWCGQFAASVVKSAGGTPPKNPGVASNWRNYGTQVQTPQPGDIAVRRGTRTGSTGSHVTIVESVDPKTGGFKGLGGNQGGGRLTVGQFKQSRFEYFRGAQREPQQQPGRAEQQIEPGRAGRAERKVEPTPDRREVDSAMGREITSRVEGAGQIDVNVKAPKGTNVGAKSSGIFKRVQMNRQSQMEPAASGAPESEAATAE